MQLQNRHQKLRLLMPMLMVILKFVLMNKGKVNIRSHSPALMILMMKTFKLEVYM